MLNCVLQGFIKDQSGLGLIARAVEERIAISELNGNPDLRHGRYILLTCQVVSILPPVSESKVCLAIGSIEAPVWLVAWDELSNGRVL